MSNSCCLHLGGFPCWHPSRCTDPVCVMQTELTRVRAQLAREREFSKHAVRRDSEGLETPQVQSVHPDP